MKKLLFTFVTVAASVGAFAQGRIGFGTDSLHLVYYNPGLPAGLGGGNLAGQPVWANNMPNGITLVADLYLGTSSSSLSLISSTTFSGATPGKWDTVLLQTAIPGGTTVYVVSQIRESSIPAEPTWTPGFDASGFSWYGRSEEFTFVLGTSTIAYPLMFVKGQILGGGLSTWADGTYNMDFVSTGSRGAIMVGIPEPSSLTLTGLGAAAMLLFRRRK